jgi:uncharacterized membrane protein YjjP (DUF1212 family)
MGAGIGAALAGLLIKIGGKSLDRILDLFSISAWRKVAAWATLAGLIAALFTAINVIIAGIYYVMPTYIQVGIGWVLPDNFSACVTAYFAATAAIALYRWKRDGIKAAMYIT